MKCSRQKDIRRNWSHLAVATRFLRKIYILAAVGIPSNYDTSQADVNDAAMSVPDSRIIIRLRLGAVIDLSPATYADDGLLRSYPYVLHSSKNRLPSSIFAAQTAPDDTE